MPAAKFDNNSSAPLGPFVAVDVDVDTDGEETYVVLMLTGSDGAYVEVLSSDPTEVQQFFDRVSEAKSKWKEAQS